MAVLSSYYPQPVVAGTTEGTFAEGNDPRFGDGLEEAPEDGVIYGRKDADWVDITEPANLQVRRGTAAEVAAITPLEGEPVWATDAKKLVVGDGSLAGGVEIGPRLFMPPLENVAITTDSITLPAARSLFRRYQSFGTTCTIDLPTTGMIAGDFYIILLQVMSGAPTLTLRRPNVSIGGGAFNYVSLGSISVGARAFYVYNGNGLATGWDSAPANFAATSARTVNDATDAATAITQLNALLAELRRLGVLA